MKKLFIASALCMLTTLCQAQEWTLKIKNYITTYNTGNVKEYRDTGIFLRLRLASTEDSFVLLYQEIVNVKREVVNRPSNIRVPRIAVRLLFDYSLNLAAINTYLSFYGIEAIKEED